MKCEWAGKGVGRGGEMLYRVEQGMGFFWY